MCPLDPPVTSDRRRVSFASFARFKEASMRTLRRFLLPARPSFFVAGWLLTCSILSAAAPALAQGGRAETNATAIDAQKAGLPGVTVTVTSENSGLTRK